eukprot:222850-Chlamydomonas_euryale.AAC.4
MDGGLETRHSCGKPRKGGEGADGLNCVCCFSVEGEICISLMGMRGRMEDLDRVGRAQSGSVCVGPERLCWLCGGDTCELAHVRLTGNTQGTCDTHVTHM